MTAVWRVDVEAVYLWHGEELNRHHYRFHVVGDRVEGWMASRAPYFVQQREVHEVGTEVKDS